MNHLTLNQNPSLGAWLNGIVDIGRHTDSNATARYFINFISNTIVINHIKLFRVEFTPSNSALLYDFFSLDQYQQASLEYRKIILVDKSQDYAPYIISNSDGTNTLLIAPIKLEDKQQLLLEINLDQYQEDDFSYLPFLIRAFVNQINLVDLNSRDSLTGLLNQRNYNEKIEQYVTLFDSSNNRREQSVSHCLAIADVDHFKKVNDKYGHLFGDDILIHIAGVFKQCFRNRDLVFRYSGEKFTIIINEVSMDTAEKILNRLRQTIEEYQFPLEIQISISIGFTSLDGATPDVLLDQAEKALYYAKEHGRNQVCFYQHLEQQGLLEPEEEQDSNIDFF